MKSQEKNAENKLTAGFFKFTVLLIGSLQSAISNRQSSIANLQSAIGIRQNLSGGRGNCAAELPKG